LLIRVGGLQFEGVNFKEDLDHIVEIIAKSNVDLFILPENWLQRGPVSLSDYIEILGRIAVRSSTYVIGAQYILENGILKSLGFLGCPDGDVRKVCEKILPSKSVGERDLLARGKLLPPFKLLGIKLGCVICVDIFYPEIARNLVLQGAQVLINPSSISRDRVNIWRAVLVARAVENSIYVVGINKVGSPYPRGRVTGGGSLVVDPEGEILSQLSEERGVLTAILDLNKVNLVEKRRGFKRDFIEIIHRRDF
jgi:predicted amidohydrolase